MPSSGVRASAFVQGERPVSTLPHPAHAAAPFITFEGIDGAGKSTHLQRVQQWLDAQGWDCLRTREPGGTALAEALRELLLHQGMDPLTEALLVFAARRDHLQQVIEPALAAGRAVLCDRFSDATFAYQGDGRGFDREVLRTLETWVQAGRQPDLTLWFDLPAEQASARLQQARAPDRFEREPGTFFARVRDGYARRAVEHPQRFVRIDATGSPQQVGEQVLAVLQQRLGARGMYPRSAAGQHSPHDFTHPPQAKR